MANKRSNNNLPPALQPQSFSMFDAVNQEEYAANVKKFSEPKDRDYLVSVPLLLNDFSIVPQRGEFAEQVYLRLTNQYGESFEAYYSGKRMVQMFKDINAAIDRGVNINFPAGVMFVPDGEPSKNGNQAYRMVRCDDLLEQMDKLTSGE